MAAARAVISKLYLVAGVVALILGLWVWARWASDQPPSQSMAAVGNEREYPLTPGPLPGWPGIDVGPLREQYNDIYGLQCAPIVELERVLGWVDRMHIAGDRLFVEPCVEMLFQSGESYWMFGDAWHEASFTGREGQRQMQLRRVDFADWDSYFNSAVPCGSLLAWWSLGQVPDGIGAELRARVGSLVTSQVLAGAALGTARLETDNPGALQPPTWDAGCTTATFDGSRYDLAPVTLDVPTPGRAP